MTIETKYNIGDEVWFMFVGNAIKSKVLNISNINGQTLYHCSFYLTTATFREDKLFPTKEELLKSL